MARILGFHLPLVLFNGFSSLQSTPENVNRANNVIYTGYRNKWLTFYYCRRIGMRCERVVTEWNFALSPRVYWCNVFILKRRSRMLSSNAIRLSFPSSSVLLQKSFSLNNSMAPILIVCSIPSYLYLKFWGQRYTRAPFLDSAAWRSFVVSC